MDLQKRLGELTEAYAAGQMDEAELARRQQELLQAVVKNSPPAGTPVRAAPPSATGSDPTGDHAGAGTLSSGMVIGPPDRQFRLLQDLNGKQRI